MLKRIKIFIVIGILSFTAVQGVALEENEGNFIPSIAEANGSEVEKANDQSRVDEGGPSTLELVGRIVIYLILLAVIGAVILHFFKQGKFIKGVGGKGKVLKVTETHMLGNKQFLIVVEYNQHKVLLGVGPGMINKLCFLDGPKKESNQEVDTSQMRNKN